MISKSLFVVLLCSALVHCQPVRDEIQLPLSNETDSSNDTSPAFNYNYSSENPRFEIDSSNPFRAMQQMLAAMEQRFNGMFGQGHGGMSIPGGMQSSSSSIFSSGGSQNGLESSNGGFFGSSFLTQPCQQTLNDNELLIKCNVTDYEPDQVKVDVNGQQLTISGKQVIAGENGQNATTQFQQILQLSDFNTQKLKSESNDGILSITIPRIPHQDEEKTTKKEQTEIA